LEYATQNSELVVSKNLSKKSKSKNVESKESAYYPTLDVGSFYQTQNERTLMQTGDIYSGYAKVSFDIYDGGVKSSALKQTKKEFKSSEFDLLSTKKSLSLEIVKDFFAIKSLEANLSARVEAKNSIKEQLIRMKRFLQARVATQDDVDRLQAAYDTNIFEIESIKLDILSIKKLLELKVGKEIDSLDDSKFIEFKEHKLELTDDIKSLMAKKEALEFAARGVESLYYPKLKVEDRYSFYGYERDDSFHPEGLDKQNKLLLSLNMRLYDNATVSKSKEAIIIQSQALNSKVSYIKKEQEIQYQLASFRIKTMKTKIKSAKSALISANSAYKIIKKKYEASIVDYIVFLDALTTQAKAKSLYQSALNDLEVAYAIYYYYSGKSVKEFLQ
jgi:outer membrane protein TolC